MKEIHRFTEWLSFHPSADEIARGVVTEYLAPLGACCCRITRLNQDDSLTFLGEYGYDRGLEGVNFPSAEWRSWKHDEALLAQDVIAADWNEKENLSLVKLRDHGATQGFMSFRFATPVKDMEIANTLIKGYSASVSLYLSLVRDTHVRANKLTGLELVDEKEISALTKRQLQILSGMVSEKTNHQMAKELGYSVSTIRHETMRIYEALAVSDRKEAAEKAVALSLI